MNNYNSNLLFKIIHVINILPQLNDIQLINQSLIATKLRINHIYMKIFLIKKFNKFNPYNNYKKGRDNKCL